MVLISPEVMSAEHMSKESLVYQKVFRCGLSKESYECVENYPGVQITPLWRNFQA